MSTYNSLKKINSLFWEKGLSPIDINNGNCYHWAYIAYKLLGGKLLYTDMGGGHAWLLLNNKHYDSEALKGERSYKHLLAFESTFIENDNIVYPKSLTEFKNHWNRNGRYGWKQKMCSAMLKQLKPNV